MTKDGFKEQFKLLMEDFGTESYPQSRVRLIWETCRDLPDKSFKQIVWHFRMTKPVKYPPLPNDFFEQAEAQRKLARGETRKAMPQNSESETQGQSDIKEILSRLGATTLMEAVKNSKK